MIQNPANSQQPVNPQNNEQAPPQQKKKPRQTFTLKPQHFQKQNGLQALYKSINELDLTNGTDNVQLTMKKITSLLKTWNFNMAPRYDFDYFLQRCKALGNHKFTQAYMSKVRKIHKGEDTWGNQVPQQTDPLNNVDLDHLNPNQQQINPPQQTLQKQIQKAMKLVNEIENKEFKQLNQTLNQKMQIQNPQKNSHENQDDQDQEDECEMLLRQMDELQKQKKILFSKSKQESKQNGQQINETKKQTPHQEEQQVPYVPQGFQDIDYGGYSSQNY